MCLYFSMLGHRIVVMVLCLVVLVLDDAIHIEFDGMVLWLDDMVILFDDMQWWIIYMCIFCLNCGDLNENRKKINIGPLLCVDTRKRGHVSLTFEPGMHLVDQMVMLPTKDTR
jgi:hypothetical protein